MLKNKKQYIIKYIKLKIQSGEWPQGHKLPSENQLSIKFDCSRTTIRQAFALFLYSGIIKSREGFGYLITEEINKMIYKSIKNKYNIDDIKLEVLPNIDNKAKELLNVSKKENVFYFKKNYYSKNKLIVSQITAMNNKYILEKNYDKFKESISKELSHQGIILEKVIINIKYYDYNLFGKDLLELGYKDNYISQNIVSYSKEGWIEKTLRVTKKEKLNETFIINKY